MLYRLALALGLLALGLHLGRELARVRAARPRGTLVRPARERLYIVPGGKVSLH
ncbi:MAG TPA: hypothetical protein VF203_06435 [Burkholderiales bacterium]